MGLMLFLFSCSSKNKHQVSTGFYYWKTSFKLQEKEEKILADLHAQSIYIRLFDIGIENGKAVPLGILNNETLDTNQPLRFVPVVFIKQNSFYQLTTESTEDLAIKTASLMQQLCQKLNINPDEIQIDCDWTKSTKELYFHFLKILQKQDFLKDKTLSCTIKMHQVKYLTSTGVPPVNRGLLMVYNMGNLSKYGGQNSIFELKESKDYLKNMQQYPLPLDIALPLYHWTIWFENQKFKGILYNVSKTDFEEKDLKKIEGDLYELRNDVEIPGYQFKKGAALRFENPDKKELKIIASYISKRLNNPNPQLLLFHLDSFALKDYSIKEMQKLINAMK